MLKKIVKNSLFLILKLFSKGYLLEYWAIKRNEKEIITQIKNSYTDFIKPSWVIFDVGANVGNYSKVFMELGAKVYAFEPQNYCIKILKKRFINKNQFVLVESALGNVNSKGVIHKPASHNIASMNEEWIKNVSNSERFGKNKWDNNEEIEITTLESQIIKFEKPDYLKIDVEGYELNVLKGLKSPISFISFEITLPEMYLSAIDCINEIMKLGNYNFFLLKNDRICESNWLEKEALITEINHLFETKELISTDIFAKHI